MILTVRDFLGPSLRRCKCGGRLVGRPAHAPARARPLNTRRTSRQVNRSAASPKPISVTQSQPGGPPSSVERVDCIGSSFPLGGNGGCSVCRLLWTSIPPRSRAVNPTRTGRSRRPRSGDAGVTRTSCICVLRRLVARRQAPGEEPPPRETHGDRIGSSRTLWPWLSRPPRRTRPPS